jgi:hypothetical protein
VYTKTERNRGPGSVLLAATTKREGSARPFGSRASLPGPMQTKRYRYPLRSFIDVPNDRLVITVKSEWDCFL